MSASSKFIDKNLNAFLDMIAWAEGTSRIKNSNDGYDVLVGGHLFGSYSDHPRVRVRLESEGTILYSTAAGRYQLLARFFDSYKKQLNLVDFSPPAQDQIAIKQINEQKATLLISSGNISKAIQNCSNIWASLPGNNYNQPEKKIQELLDVYESKGGILIK